ncbi:GTPase HflX [Fusibacter sp. JL298sf-3]
MKTSIKTVIVGLNTQQNAEFECLMEELELLAEACELEVVGMLVQNSSSPTNATYIGSGKVDELRLLVEANDAERVVFAHELSPKQLRNLERALQVDVQDRTALILEIFSRRAKTKEARMQVELAELQYLLPRLAGSYMAMGRQRGGSGTRNKGAGEKKIELDKRKAGDKITELRNALTQIEKERQTQRKKRTDTTYPLVALVGYTNAGKSTLMNHFVRRSQKDAHKTVFEKDMLFATLDTSVRLVTLGNKMRLLLSDTVGFVSDLPHTLVKAFGSTLEEVVEADLLLHVIDASNPEAENQRQVTLDTLERIGASDIPVVYVYNKCDCVEGPLPEGASNAVYVSAKTGRAMDTLEAAIREALLKDYVTCNLLIPYTSGSVLNYFNEHALVHSREHLENGTLIKVACHEADLQKYNSFVQS